MDELRARLPAEVAAWLAAHGDDLVTAWRSCPRGDWLVHIALCVGVGRAALVRATSEVVSLAMARHRGPDLRPHRAFVTSLRWLAGRAPSRDAWAAGFAATDAAETLEDPRHGAAARAAACLAFACDDQADHGYYAHRAYAAAAVRHTVEAIGDDVATADRFREALPLAEVLEAYARAGRPPPTLSSVPEPIDPTPNPFLR